MATTHPEAQWFRGAGLGVFIHWGPYALRGIEASWPLQPHSPQYIDVASYEALANDFNPQNYDPQTWAREVKRAGASYVILTAKHHDGFCLFDTKTTDYCAVKAGPKRDLVGPYISAMQAEGLKVGLYFTTIDWHDPDFATIPIHHYITSPKPFSYDPLRWYQFHARFMEQLRELLTNYGRIDLIWFDVPGFGADRWRSSEVKQMMLNLQPHLVINDRLPDAGDYVTPEQQIPFEGPAGWWETCMTMNHQWAYHPDTSTYKSTAELIRTLTEVVSKGGNLLLNVGPKPDGSWPQEAVTRYREIGAWLEHSGEGIYGTTRGPHPTCFHGPMTRKGRTLYLHVHDLPRSPLIVQGIFSPVEKVRLLRTAETLNFAQQPKALLSDGHVRIELPGEKCDPISTIVAIDFAEEPDWPEARTLQKIEIHHDLASHASSQS
jgi:alpha-L-fucosidase